MHTQSSGGAEAWWPAAGLPGCEESQAAASKRVRFPHNLLPGAI